MAVRSTARFSTALMCGLFFASWAWTAIAVFSGEGAAWQQVVGLLLLCAGVTIRAVAMANIGNSYSTSIRVVGETGIVQHGMYAIVRHPLHLGILVQMCGMSVLTGSLMCILFLIAQTGLVLWRNGVEDKVLRATNGERAAQYKNRVPSMNLAVGLWRVHVRSRLGSPHRDQR